MAENKINTPCKALLIGGSAGSLEVLLRILPGLRADLGFPVVIVLHRKNSSESSIASIFSGRTSLIVREIEDKQILSPGHIYIAPADYHVLFENNTLVSLDYSEKVNYSRPSIDVSFESAAEVFGPSLVCLLLSGANSDGSKGLKIVKEKGGTVLIHDPETAESPFMPSHALGSVNADKVVKTEDMTALINSL